MAYLNDIKYNRLSDEVKNRYMWRICSKKTNKSYTLNWKEVGEILNKEFDENWTSSKWRKNYQMMQKGYDFAIEDGADSSTQLADIKQAIFELKIERKKVQSESIEYNKILREGSRSELVREHTIQAIKNVEKLPLPKFKLIQKDSKKLDYILSFADVHAYSRFQSITNNYSKAELELRMNDLFNEVIAVIIERKISKITIVNGGDSLEGILRASALGLLELGVQDTVIEYRRFLAQWLNALSTYVEIDYIQVISSNHTEHRPLNTRAGQFPNEDFEKDIASYIQDKLEDNLRVNVIIPENAYYHLTLGKNEILIHHGHGIKSTKSYLDSMSRKLKVWFTTLLVAHKHNEEVKTEYEDIDGGDVQVIQIPSIIGSCKYSDSINKGAKSSALFMGFNEKGRKISYKFILN